VQSFENERDEAFNILDELADLEQHDLELQFSKDNIIYLRILLQEFHMEELLVEPISLINFTEIVYKLRETKRFWGRLLGDSIIQAAEMANRRETNGGIKILEAFIEKCPSPCYREHARNQIKYYLKTKDNE
jgi:hypothetical protein